MLNAFLIGLAALAVPLTWYTVWGRSWLKTKSWADGFFAKIEPIELLLYKKSETILFARLKVLSGVVLMVLTQLGEINLAPIMPFLSEKHQGYLNFFFNLLPLIISVMGMMDEKLRNQTTKPIELVALPEAEKAKPEVAAVIAQAEASKAEAVAVAKDSINASSNT